jgi:glycosyltransferase involved in cell wall biosynthesis
VFFDLSAVQNAEQRHRGIARYATEQALAVAAGYDHIGGFVLNPDLTLPERVDDLLAAAPVLRVDEVDWSAVDLLHIASPFEMAVPLPRLLPPAARAAGVPWVVTFYDLIPLLMPEYYLEDPGLRRRYRARVQLVRAAEGILTLSEATRRDAVDHLGLDPGRVSVVGAGVGAEFVPPESRPAAAAAAAAAVPGLRPRYVFYTGSYEKRKNLERLLEAWALVPEALRREHQLVVTCPLQPLQRNHLLWLAEQAGLGDDLVLTGWVPEQVLLHLYQGAELFVFPSLYEGYGLPVAEALACGAPVLASDSSSMPEIVGPESLFDPNDASAMAAAIERGIVDEDLRARLLAASGRPPSTWADVARATVEAYDKVLTGRERRARPLTGTGTGRPPRIAFAGVVGAGAGPQAEHDRALVEALAEHGDVRLFVDRVEPADAGPAGIPTHPVANLGAVEALRGPFDLVVYSLADDDHHTGCLAALLRRPGVVLAHDVRLPRLYEAAAAGGALETGLGATLTRFYGDGVPGRLGETETLAAAEAVRAGVLMVNDVAATATRLVVTSEDAAALVRLSVPRSEHHKLTVVPADSGPKEMAAALVAFASA